MRVVGSPTPRPAGTASRPSQASRACDEPTHGAGYVPSPESKGKGPQCGLCLLGGCESKSSTNFDSSLRTK
jgi:hypothetical protein